MRNSKSYWKEAFLLLFGILLGILYEKHFPNSLSNEKVISIDVKRDTIVNKDTLYVKTIVPLNEENVYKELKRQNIPHAEVVLAQSKLETGNYTSVVCKNNKNLFGIRKNNKYKKYNTWKESIADYKKLISSRYKGDKNYYQFLIDSKYAEDPMYVKKLKEMV